MTEQDVFTHPRILQLTVSMMYDVCPQKKSGPYIRMYVTFLTQPPEGAMIVRPSVRLFSTLT